MARTRLYATLLAVSTALVYLPAALTVLAPCIRGGVELVYINPPPRTFTDTLADIADIFIWLGPILYLLVAIPMVVLLTRPMRGWHRWAARAAAILGVVLIAAFAFLAGIPRCGMLG